MNLFAQIPQFFLALAISIIVILIPISNSALLMNGIQTAKSFSFFNPILSLVVIATVAIFITKGKLKGGFAIFEHLAFIADLPFTRYRIKHTYLNENR